MNDVVDKLNRLLAVEQNSLIARLGEATPFVSLASAVDGVLAHRMVEDERRHARELTELILKLRGVPVPVSMGMSAGEYHYLDIGYLMPTILADKRRILAAYESTSPTGNTEADTLIRANLADHRRHLTDLERLHANLLAQL